MPVQATLVPPVPKETDYIFYITALVSFQSDGNDRLITVVDRAVGRWRTHVIAHEVSVYSHQRLDQTYVQDFVHVLCLYFLRIVFVAPH